MARGKLDAKTIQAIKPPQNKFKNYSDGQYLYLRVYAATDKHPKGRRSWYFNGKFLGKSFDKKIGEYDYLSLAEARDKRDTILADFKNGIDPFMKAKQAQEAIELAKNNTFGHWVDKWLETKANVAPTTYNNYLIRLNKWILPTLGKRAINEITRKELITFLEGISKAGQYETRNKSTQIINNVLELALNHEAISVNPAANILKALTPKPRTNNLPALIDTNDIAAMLQGMYGYKGTAIVQYALKISPHVLLRPGELRRSQWDWIDFTDNLWRLPAEVMKAREPHLVPISSQVRALLLELKAITGNGKYLFPHYSQSNKVMSENTVNHALHKLGYKNQQTAHGLRSVASTLLHGKGFQSEIIEAQLAHKDTKQIRAIYNRTDYLVDRRKLLQSWSDIIDELLALPIHASPLTMGN